MVGRADDDEPGDYPTAHLGSGSDSSPKQASQEPPQSTSPAISGRPASTPEASASGVLVSASRQPVIVETTDLDGGGLPGLPSGSDFSISTISTNDRNELLAATYEGLLPPPSHLREYEEIAPGAAREIISWVPEESNHRRQQEIKEMEHRMAIELKECEHRMALEKKGMQLGEKALGWGIFRANVGMFLAWPLVIGIIASGTYLIHEGNGAYGIAMVESGLLIVVGAFVLQKIERWIKPGKTAAAEEKQSPEK